MLSRRPYKCGMKSLIHHPIYIQKTKLTTRIVLRNWSQLKKGHFTVKKWPFVLISVPDESISFLKVIKLCSKKTEMCEEHTKSQHTLLKETVEGKTHCLFKLSTDTHFKSYLPGTLDSVTSERMSCLISVLSVAMVTAWLGCDKRRRSRTCGCYRCCTGLKGAGMSFKLEGVRRETHKSSVMSFSLNVCSWLPPVLLMICCLWY